MLPLEMKIVVTHDFSSLESVLARVFGQLIGGAATPPFAVEAQATAPAGHVGYVLGGNPPVAATPAEEPKRKGGRPLGSRNKPKDDAQVELPPVVAPAVPSAGVPIPPAPVQVPASAPAPVGLPGFDLPAPAPVAAAVTPEQLRDASLMLANKKGDAAYRTIYAQMGSKPLAAMTDAERATMYQLVVTATNQP